MKKNGKSKNTETPDVKLSALAPEDGFDREIAELSVSGSADTDGRPKPQKRKISRLENIIQLSLIVVFAAVFIVCAVMLIKNISGKIKGNNIYDKLAGEINITVPGEESDGDKPYSTMLPASSDMQLQTLYSRLSSGKTDAENGSIYSAQLQSMRASLTSLRDINSDVYGWIYVPGTNINYPVMRGEDNDYYLDHAYTHDVLPIGSIFVDYATKDVINDNRNTIIYGHNVTTGAMFHDVTKFFQKDFFDSTQIYIYTLDGIYIYKPVSVYQTTSDYHYYRTQFANDESFLSFASEILANSQVASAEKFTADDSLITLSTCTNGAQNGRYALHAKLIQVIQ